MSEAKLPTRAHETDLCWDLYASEEAIIQAGDTVIVNTGISLGCPEGYGVMIQERSGLASRGIAIGGRVVDSGYVGPIKVIMRYHPITSNTTFLSHKIHPGDKIAQFRLVKRIDAEIIEVSELDFTDRADKGFGSSGQ